MPELNWDVFAKLPGSAEKNFELLCRGIVRQNFGSYGVVRALANQPGVEFHLKLDQRSDALGDPGRWWGWQCKWYDLPPSGILGATRRAKIEEGIHKTEAHVPDVTDWVLWTRRPLTKTDQTWFMGISSKMTLHLWTSDEIDNLLVGQAAVLRATYFGELVLTPDILRERHEQAIAPIRGRWQPEVHHIVDAERELRRMLGESDAWDELRVQAVDLRAILEFVESAPTVPTALAPLVASVVDTSRQSADALDRIAVGIHDGDLDLLRGDLTSQPRVLAPDVATAPRRLRSGNHRAGLYVTNAVAGCRETLRLITDVEDAFSSRVVAVLAPAGCGKTHLAAQLTAGTDSRPHGVLLHGRDLHAHHTLDDLARRISIAAQPVQSMESLLAAVDAAGQRACHRLPVIIDGLNESEDPRAWKPLLAVLETALAKYPYVLLVCTLRPEFADEALPDGTRSVEIDGYGVETPDAIRLHFRYWKIDATDALLPGFLQHPLTLRLFCEVTNPTRQMVVGIDAMPGSLTALFDRYLDQVGDRIAQLAPRTQRYYAQDVRAALTIVANALWDSRNRFIDIDELRRALGDDRRPWDQSLVRALEHEGVLLRMPSDGSGAYVPVYDRLGGHIIANALLARHGQGGFETWIREPSTTMLLAGDYNDRHPLADDVMYSLVGQIPRRFHSKQLWQLVDEPMCSRALQIAARLEAAYLDAATVDALLDLVRQGDALLLGQLWEVRGTASHPLNAEALDRVLRPMGVADRDLRWTEWIRKNQDKVLRDLQTLEQRWRQQGTRKGDQLRARWVMWTLASTVRQLRDQATRTLYCFGFGDPNTLFDLTIEALGVNDPYIPERMLAASYGVAMGFWADPRGAVMREALPGLANTLVNWIFIPGAPHPTRHTLIRDYALGLISLASRVELGCVPMEKLGLLEPPFEHFPSPFPPSAQISDTEVAGAKDAISMDFGNYTLGRLIPKRNNYDFKNPTYREVRRQIEKRIVDLGYSPVQFSEIDKRIGEDSWRAGNRQTSKTDRYGKKYSWIAYFEMYGYRLDKGLLPEWRSGERTSDADIDPSFPEPARTWIPSLPNLFDNSPSELREWIADGLTPDYDHILHLEEVDGQRGPWVLLNGYIEQSSKDNARRFFSFLRGLLVNQDRVVDILDDFDAIEYPGNMAIPEPREYCYTFAGEIPWSLHFTRDLRDSDGNAKKDLRQAFEVHDGTQWLLGIPVEVPAIWFGWESYHSELNQVSGIMVPAPALCDQLGLSNRRGEWDLYDREGRVATIYREFKFDEDIYKSKLLYLRADLMAEYLENAGQTLVWLNWGERDLEYKKFETLKSELQGLWAEHRHIHRRRSCWTT